MTSIKPKSAFLTVRVAGSTRAKFYLKSQKYGQPSDVLREIIEAFIEDRLTINPPVTRKESLYVTGK